MRRDLALGHDWEERQLCQERFTSGEGQQKRWINLSLLSLLAVGLGLIFCMLVFGLVFSDQPQGNITMVDTLATLHLPKTSTPKTKYLVDWMRSLNLDLLNETRLATVNPVEMMVRGSLDLGVQAVISISFNTKIFPPFKRTMTMEFSVAHRKTLRKDWRVAYYRELLWQYGVKRPLDGQLASKIKEYERHYEWATFISTYTNGTYKGSDLINHRPESTTVIKEALERRSLGIEGLRYLVAWYFYFQLVKKTEPKGLRGARTSFVACYHHIKKVMNLAVVSPIFLETAVTPRMVQQTKFMVSQIRSAFVKAFNSSTWLSSKLKREAIEKLTGIRVFAGSQGRRLDPNFIKKGSTLVSLARSSFRWSSMLRLLSISSEEQVSHYRDSENLADLVGTMLGYSAYSSLPKKYKTVTLPGSSMSLEQLFFISNCVKWCAERSGNSGKYAPPRSRCIDPRGRMNDKDQLLVGETCEQRSRSDRKRIATSYLCLLALLPGALCGIFIAVFVFATLSPDATTKVTDMVTELQIPTVSVSDNGHPPSAVVVDRGPPPTQANVSVRPRRPAQRFRPAPRPPQGVCMSAGCRFAAQWLLSTLNFNLDPCMDFYGYVCGSFRGLSQLTHISFSSIEGEWLHKRRALPDDVNKNHYAMLLLMYGVQRPREVGLAARLVAYEREVASILSGTIQPNAPAMLVAIRDFGSRTIPFVNSDQWTSYFSTYTNNVYRGEDSIIVQQSVFNFITTLLRLGSVGKLGLQYLVAWSVYTQLVDYTVPLSLRRNRGPSDACYEHVGRAMRYALTSPYFQTDQVTVAEEIAIALALKAAEVPCGVYSDSRSAVRALSGGSISQQAARLLRSGRSRRDGWVVIMSLGFQRTSRASMGLILMLALTPLHVNARTVRVVLVRLFNRDIGFVALIAILSTHMRNDLLIIDALEHVRNVVNRKNVVQTQT
ncbi:hypothetical protein HPB50_018838 [Hyalomma asiaticum]|uniref:Uncharacterized protein n=1 Tax=Hyalomma asiaticum TaxID=266040 RepID=A0ACB7SG36_HYAAI|nr:hypothetical protein HPB50_018838 [Hyalomma asiaticum]